ncbi:MAG: hypothetical protein NY202_03140 [Mollicutes bacterium UO1]
MEDDVENKNDKKQLEILRKELERLKGEKTEQVQLKTVKLNILLVLRQLRRQFEEKEYLNYEGKINTANSREGIEIIAKEFLLKIKQKKSSLKSDGENKDKLAEIERKNKELGENIKLSNAEMEKLR